MAGFANTWPRHPGVLAFIAGFLAQFPDAGGYRVTSLTSIMPPGISSSTVSEPCRYCSTMTNLLVRRDGHDVDPVDGVDDEEVVLLAGARRDFAVGAQREDAEVADRVGNSVFSRVCMDVHWQGSGMRCLTAASRAFFLRRPALAHEAEQVLHGVLVGCGSFPRRAAGRACPAAPPSRRISPRDNRGRPVRRRGGLDP